MAPAKLPSKSKRKKHKKPKKPQKLVVNSLFLQDVRQQKLAELEVRKRDKRKVEMARYHS